jgi:NAD(P)-dependent dehydrogenase (short-subunit alcohol dehydrogenase family)
MHNMHIRNVHNVQAGIVKDLAEHGVRVNSVSPGMTKTDMVTDAVLAANMSNIPMGRC